MTQNAAGIDYLSNERPVAEALNIRYDQISDLIRGMTTKSVAGTGTLALTTTDAAPEARRFALNLIGALTGNRTILIPTTSAGRLFLVYNNTTGAYTLTVKATTDGATAAGTGITITQGYARLVWHDGTNVYAAGGEVTITGVPTWTTPTLLNSWVNFSGSDSAAAYTKINGVVFLKGVVKNGSAINTVIFNLPAGYRPAENHHYGTVSNSLFGYVSINSSTGAVTAVAGSTTWISLDGISFPAEA